MRHFRYLHNLLTFSTRAFFIRFELCIAFSSHRQKCGYDHRRRRRFECRIRYDASNVVRTFRFDRYILIICKYTHRNTIDLTFLFIYFFSFEVFNLPYNLIMSSIRFRENWEKPFRRDKNNKKSLSLFVSIPTMTTSST